MPSEEKTTDGYVKCIDELATAACPCAFTLPAVSRETRTVAGYNVASHCPSFSTSMHHSRTTCSTSGHCNVDRPHRGKGHGVFFDSGCRGVVRVQARIILHHGEVKRLGHQQTFQSFTPPMLDLKDRLLIALIAQDVRAREAAMPRVSSQTQEWTFFGIIVQCLGLGWWWWWWCFLRLMLLIVAMAVSSLQMHCV